MRYKDYTWPHNPETYTVERRRSVALHKVPFGGYCLQDLGDTCGCCGRGSLCRRRGL
jgi:hypothetical protein